MKINLLKVLNIQIMSEQGKENRASLFSQDLFLIASHYYNETNKPTVN